MDGVFGTDRTMVEADLTKMWARIQEGLLNLIDHATALQLMMDQNPASAINPARRWRPGGVMALFHDHTWRFSAII